MNKKKFVFASIFASMTALAITACGDDVTKINEIHQDGMAVLEKGQKLSEQACDTANVGEMLFVMDSSEAFICDGKSWQTLKGEKGETGDAGKDGSDGANGTSCTVKSVKNKDDLRGLEVTCGKTVVDTIWNGAAGKDGKPGDSGKDGSDGANGTNCTAKSVENDAGLKGFELTCGETVVGTIWNGKKGGDGETGKDGASCSLTDDGNGSVVVTCGDDDPVTINKAVCGAKPYDPKKQFCDTRDNQIYKTVKIGDQVWMAENLNYSVNSDVQSWCGGGESGTTNEGDCSVYGRLYTWAAAVGKSEEECGYEKTCNLPSGDIRGVCPEGWHLPDTTEWNTLIDFAGGMASAGKMLKASTGWEDNNGSSGNGMDAFGFSALPAGRKNDPTGSFVNVGAETAFMSAVQKDQSGTNNNGKNAFLVILGNAYEKAAVGAMAKTFATSVRCLQNN